ncbi:hypothetical protein QFC22_006591 [Naganishia vaughanmartiniae]|uniref:Uncharacterized protein n=1 Tax=Naganishia vaughanmartiniae TaxID=1424756 RepID=A0ACC2WIH6_9TREE|nr:hypothetical protein QFC22_006591 [Naganishia vaughanmartiniae]
MPSSTRALTKPQGENILAELHEDVYPAIDPKTTLKGCLKDHTVVIIGAGRGIGKEIGVAFAEAGCSTLVLCSRSVGQLNETKDAILSSSTSAPPTIIVQQVDVTLNENFQDLFALLEEKKLSVDVWVNNAGYMESIASIHEQNPETCTSSEASTKQLPGVSAYSGSKTAVNRLTEAVQAEYGDKGVRAFAVHPGAVPTELATTLPAQFHWMLVDKPLLMAGFCVYLVAKENHTWLRPWQGAYMSSKWDVEHLKEMDVEALAKDGRWGVEGWGKMRCTY